MSDSKTYNQRVLLALRNRGDDDSKIAKMIGASRTTVNQIINGKRSGRNIEPQIRKVAQALNLTSEELGIEASNIVVKIPPTGLKMPPEPTTLAGKIKEGAKGAWEQMKLNAHASALEYEEQRKERNRTARAKPRQHDTLQEPPLPKASKVKPGDIVEVDRTGRPKRKPRTSQSSKLWKRADKLGMQYPSMSQMVRQFMGPEEQEEQEQLVTLKTLPDGRLAVGVKQEAQWCVYCQRRPGTMLLPYKQGFICRECSQIHITDPRVYM